MGFKTKYTEATNQLGNMVQDMFDKLSFCCKCREYVRGGSSLGPKYHTCLYYGRTGKQKCEMEACPLLGDEVVW